MATELVEGQIRSYAPCDVEYGECNGHEQCCWNHAGWNDTFSASRRKELVGSFVHAAGSALIACIFRRAVSVTAVFDKAGIRVQTGWRKR